MSINYNEFNKENIGDTFVFYYCVEGDYEYKKLAPEWENFRIEGYKSPTTSRCDGSTTVNDPASFKPTISTLELPNNCNPSKYFKISNLFFPFIHKQSINLIIFHLNNFSS